MKVLGLAIGLAVAAAGCGSDPFCGDGVTQEDNDEQCDDGNDDETDFCRACNAWLPARTTMKWAFNEAAAPDFTSDSCTDVGAFSVAVTMTGPETVTLEDMCSNRQVVFEGLMAGTYTASAVPLDADGEPLVSAPATLQVTVVDEMASDQTVVIPPDAWIGPYTGTFFFTTAWDGEDCAAAGVVSQELTLTVDGTVVTQTTTGGTPLDGSATGACVPASVGSPQSAVVVPFGLATLEIVGLDAGDAEVYRGTFDTFVGAGIFNPTLAFDVVGPAGCADYCATIATSCAGVEAQYGDQATCLASCATFPQGTIGDMSGDSLECRDYHAAAAATDATTHCVHAGPGGAGVCGANCAGFCDIVMASCTGGNMAYATLSDCMTSCAAFADTEKFDTSDTSGNTLACRLYHATAASTDPVSHCGHTEPVSATCF